MRFERYNSGVRFTAAAVQIAPFKGDIEANARQIGAAAARCSKEGADLVVFPETSLSGYFLEAGTADVALSASEAMNKVAAQIGKPERDLDVIFGFYERADGAIYNSSLHASFSAGGANLVAVHRKFFLPTYGVFDEERFVARGRQIEAYDTRFGRMSMLICEEIWHSAAPMIAALKGAETIAAISASPARNFAEGTFANLDRTRRLLRAISEEHGVWCINAMLVGFEGGKGFSGGSVVVDPSGRIVAEGPALEEHILMAEIDLGEIERVRSQSPMLADLRSVLEDVTREICEANDQS